MTGTSSQLEAPLRHTSCEGSPFRRRVSPLSNRVGFWSGMRLLARCCKLGHFGRAAAPQIPCRATRPASCAERSGGWGFACDNPTTHCLASLLRWRRCRWREQGRWRRHKARRDSRLPEGVEDHLAARSDSLSEEHEVLLTLQCTSWCGRGTASGAVPGAARSFDGAP